MMKDFRWCFFFVLCASHKRSKKFKKFLYHYVMSLHSFLSNLFSLFEFCRLKLIGLRSVEEVEKMFVESLDSDLLILLSCRSEGLFSVRTKWCKSSRFSLIFSIVVWDTQLGASKWFSFKSSVKFWSFMLMVTWFDSSSCESEVRLVRFIETRLLRRDLSNGASSPKWFELKDSLVRKRFTFDLANKLRFNLISRESFTRGFLYSTEGNLLPLKKGTLIHSIDLKLILLIYLIKILFILFIIYQI